MEEVTQIVTLPRSWSKRFHREALLSQVEKAEFWTEISPVTPQGRELLGRHEDLFQFLDKSEIEFRLIQPDGNSFVAVPLLTVNQGIALSQGLPSTVDVSVFLYPSFFYSHGQAKETFLNSLRFPLATGKPEDIAPLIARLWPLPTEEKMAVIPFTLESAAVLYGNFLDDLDQTTRICFEAVKNDPQEQATQNCRTFIDALTQVVHRHLQDS